MNVERMEQVRDHVVANTMFTLSKVQNECGTPACVMGSAIEVSGLVVKVLNRGWFISVDDENGNCLWLFPYEWFSKILDGYELESISGKLLKFDAVTTDDDQRGGVLAYDIRASGKSAVEKARGALLHYNSQEIRI
jgi:hypothetical protein